MIKSARQLRIAEKKMAALMQAIEQTESASERESLDRLCSQVRFEVLEFKAIESRAIVQFPFQSFEDVADVLVNARISRGWNQKRLAEKLGVVEQSVQRDESHDYEGASWTRIADVAEVLGYEIQGMMSPARIRAAEVAETSAIFETKVVLQDQDTEVSANPVQFSLEGML